MRKSLDTRLISNLNKRKPIHTPWYNTYTITDDDIDKVELIQEYGDGRKGYRIWVKKLYTGVNDFGFYLEKHFNLEEIRDITITATTLPDFYFSIEAANEIGDDIFEDNDINAMFNYRASPEVPVQPYYLDGLEYGDWLTGEYLQFFNFNGVWIFNDVIRG